MSATFTFTEPETQLLTDSDGIPTVLKNYDHWLVVNQEKEPVEPRGVNPTAVSRLLSFGEAESRRSDNQYLAFQFSETPFVGIDYDDVAEDQTFLAEGFETGLKQEFDTYTEWSSSGTGVHQIVRGSLSDDHGHRHDLTKPDGSHMEVYDDLRYFVLTGDTLSGFEAGVADYSGKMHDWHAEVFDENSDEVEVDLSQEATADVRTVRTTLEEYAKTNHGLAERAQTCLDIWNSRARRGEGQGSGLGSEKDWEFVLHLIFWCKGDARLVQDCWLSSNRADKKTVTRDDYRERTISRAMSAYTGDTFNGHYC